ncbi:MAG: hypothetical protein AAF514_14690 [Verrucomicrobiota bacterium]
MSEGNEGSCAGCGMTVSAADHEYCPKCDEPLRGAIVRGLYEVDIAHSGETWEVADRKLMQAFNQALLGQHKGLKVVHGYGSGLGHSSSIRNRAVPKMRRLAEQTGAKLVRDRNTEGAHILYFN